MDVIDAHVRRLPPLDERWDPRAYDRGDLARALLAGGVAGTATHPLDNVRGNILLLIDGDPDKLFGLSGLPGRFGLDDILSMVEAGAGAPIDHDERFGPVDIRPEPVLDVCAAFGDRLREASERDEAIVLATGHPTGLALFYHRLDTWLTERGVRVLAPAQGERWRDTRLPHDWFIDHWGGVGMLTDGNEPRHTHWPDAMQHMLAEVTPDLVVADHGFAGASIEAGIETLSIADVNDPALLVAQAQGRTEHVLVMDDHVDPSAYWPCFQALASRWESPKGFWGYPGDPGTPYNPPIVRREPFTEARLLTVNEVADLLRVSRMTVYRLIKTGEMPALRVGRSYRLREEDVTTYLRERYTEAG